LKDIKSRVRSFHQQLQSDENHRYTSWEHCFSYFSQKKLDESIACLHLSFYLASWGMYRGSSFLLWKDYLVHREVVRNILSLRHLRNIDFSKPCNSRIDEIFELSSWIKTWYQDKISHVNGTAKKINATNTLVTKILLGTLGCIPAYDRYFIEGLRAKGLSYSNLSKNNFLSVVDFYRRHRHDFDSLQRSINPTNGIHYPTMKLVDMYFWQIGFEKNSKNLKSRSLIP
jgi:hypothetical protein